MHELQQQVVEHVRHVEHRVAEVRNLEVDDPHAITDEHILRREVAVHETDMGGLHLGHERRDRRRQLRAPLGDRAMKWIDAQLIEGLVIREALRDERVTKGRAVPLRQRLTEAGRDLSVHIAGEQKALPRHPARRRRFDRERAALTIDIEHRRHGVRSERPCQHEGICLADRALALCEPQILHAQPRQRLLQDDARRAAIGGKDHVRDASAQLADHRVLNARHGAALG